MEIVGDKIDTNRILLATKINNRIPRVTKLIARPYFHFSLTSQFDVIIISISVLSQAGIRVPAAGLQ
jgi:hypothetical protein